MSAHNVLENQLVADHTLISPATADELVAVDRSPAILEAEVNCKISTPQAAGLRLTVVSSSGCQISPATSSERIYSSNANSGEVTSLTLNAGQLIELISVSKGSGFQYKKIN
jgi:hypothetical protein